MMKTKNFDCIAMKRVAAEKIQEQLKDKSPSEQYAFWQAGEQELRSKCRAVLTTTHLAKAA
jgi:hypothetical protein